MCYVLFSMYYAYCLPVKNHRGPFSQREPTNCSLQVLYVKKTSKNKVEDIQRFLILLDFYSKRKCGAPIWGPMKRKGF